MRCPAISLAAWVAAAAFGSPEAEHDDQEVEPDLRVVVRRGPFGFGVVATPDNLITRLRGPAAEDGLLRVGDRVVEVDGERIPKGESLVSVVKRQQRDAYTLGMRRPPANAAAVAEAEAAPPSLAELVTSMLSNPQIRGAVSTMAARVVQGKPLGGDGTTAALTGTFQPAATSLQPCNQSAILRSHASNPATPTLPP